MKIEVIEREEGVQALDLKEYSRFFEWPMAQGGSGGLFIVPTSKEPLEESFTGQVRWTSLEASRNFLDASPNETNPVKASGSQWEVSRNWSTD